MLLVLWKKHYLTLEWPPVAIMIIYKLLARIAI